MTESNIIFRTNGPWGPGKGANLLPEEVDENFYNLDQRQQALEENPPQPNDIANIEMIGTQMTIFLEDGSQFGPFTMPTARFSWRGEYTPGVDYQPLDFVTVQGRGVYLVEQATTGATEFDPDEATTEGPVFRLMFAVSQSFEVGFFYPGALPSDSIIWAYQLTKASTFDAAFADCFADMLSPPDDETVLTLEIAGGPIATLTFNPTDGGAVFENVASPGNPIDLPAGAVIVMRTPDQTGSLGVNLTVTLSASRTS